MRRCGSGRMPGRRCSAIASPTEPPAAVVSEVSVVLAAVDAAALGLAEELP
jgi:hypothetical protein